MIFLRVFQLLFATLISLFTQLAESAGLQQLKWEILAFVEGFFDSLVNGKIALTCLATCNDSFESIAVAFCHSRLSFHTTCSRVCNNLGEKYWRLQIGSIGMVVKGRSASRHLRWLFQEFFSCFQQLITLIPHNSQPSAGLQQVRWEQLACADSFFSNWWWNGKSPSRV